MDNFDLRKYLAESRLHEENPNQLDIFSPEEEAYVDPIKKKAEQRYKTMSDEDDGISIPGVGEPFEEIKVIPKGEYTIVEGDMEGRYFSSKFNVTLLKPMKPFDLAVQLAQETGWISPWGYLEMRKDHNRELKTTFTFPLQPSLFDKP